VIPSNTSQPESRLDRSPTDAADQVMEDMALIVAHRIRGLVTTIEGFTDLLTETLADRQQREMALRIFESAARIESILADLQTYARRPRPAPARSDSRTVLIDLAVTIDEDVHGIVDVLIPDEVIDLRIDAALTRQALLVLVNNAAEASPEGGVSVRCERTANGARIIVRNPGVMHPEVAARAFEPFYTTKAHNLGVGLNIAKSIATEQGGGLQLIANEADAGTEFALDLPGDWGGEVPQ
jgi:signal transduction histidine kinase